MKRIYTLLCVLLAIALAAPVFAVHPPWITDNANLLSDSEYLSLMQAAQELQDEYGMDVVILTVGSTNGKDITSFADDYYDNCGYSESGVLLVLAMDEREWAISTSGNAIDALTDYGQEQLMDEVAPYFSAGNYHAGFYLYLQKLDTYFETYQSGNPINRQPNYVLLIAVSLGIGLAAAAITVAVLKSGMKTAVAQKGATQYVKEGSFVVSRQQDIFLYSHTSKTSRSESSSGGSSTHRSSSGRSHGGSRGRF